ncbi:PEPTIDYL-TRNA HYDROLASE (PTH) [Mycoplasmopsis pulmonis]|uniref:Peptidyl-tRNA hydrolase n=1 Tax=Mycoplasmopsis pulmonis (strain UAB CTIP) TaxID=272635 RepID=PTH_MYCPU|nr:aminoacyl-tRNA hydrolase [Mycoplasmopsis pulmonis]Q98PE2.1 RecName: Full=Peptidyl-tRNA hydrolase; Short=PTH [Mycoplasmopsis pulmonis UAB CTIP]MDZ7293377.1 aminoacyl-tRNA hydrolase [Mycoplasmopsis pulmonis]CAC13954.1 PEPTIDYL-TRNA HYDROLASE (PTH) [Mycoplasmopsis pulmonis]VEU68542.1 peptidyl-tRNA hydrolase [Mycoplasmopsis pulmonis]
MKLIVGLGNPGDEYDKTRHNLGFMVIDKIAEKLNVKLDKEKFNGIFYKGENYIISKPLTYMNNSGNFVYDIKNFFDIEIDNIIIIYDEIDLKVGQASIKIKGSANGQRGMQSIIEKLKTENIKRIKIGVSRPLYEPVSSYILKKIPENEKETFEKVIDELADKLLTYIFNDFKTFINVSKLKNSKK